MNVREEEAAEDLAKHKARERVVALTQDFLNTKIDETKTRALSATIRYINSTTEVLFMLARIQEVSGDKEGAERLRVFAKDFAPYEASTWKVRSP